MKGGMMREMPHPPSQDCHARAARFFPLAAKPPLTPRVPAGPHWAIVEIGRICQPSAPGFLVPGATRPPCLPYLGAGSHRGKDPER